MIDISEYGTTQTRQTAAPVDSIPLSSTNRQAREVARMVTGGQMIVDAPYQRPSVWGLTQRINLVRSWLSRTPVPAIIINDRMHSRWRGDNTPYLDGVSPAYAVIDGKQRVETAIAWFDSEFAVPASWFPAEEVAETIETPDGPYVTFEGLTLRGQRFFSNSAMLPVAEGSLDTVAAEAALYVQVNTSGTEQTPEDIARATSHT